MLMTGSQMQTIAPVLPYQPQNQSQLDRIERRRTYFSPIFPRKPRYRVPFMFKENFRSLGQMIAAQKAAPLHSIVIESVDVCVVSHNVGSAIVNRDKLGASSCGA